MAAHIVSAWMCETVPVGLGQAERHEDVDALERSEDDKGMHESLGMDHVTQNS